MPPTAWVQRGHAEVAALLFSPLGVSPGKPARKETGLGAPLVRQEPWPGSKGVTQVCSELFSASPTPWPALHLPSSCFQGWGPQLRDSPTTGVGGP